jgi:hypothetical protein
VHDRDAKFSESFRDTVMAGGVKPLKLPGEKPEFEFICGALGTFGERGMSVEAGAVWGGFVAPSGGRICHYVEERSHQGKGNVLLFRRTRNASAVVRAACAAKSDWAAS